MPTDSDDEPPAQDAPQGVHPLVRRRRGGRVRLDRTDTHELESNDSGFAVHVRPEILNPDHRQDDDQ